LALLAMLASTSVAPVDSTLTVASNTVARLSKSFAVANNAR
jgi:hypothetical protein